MAPPRKLVPVKKPKHQSVYQIFGVIVLLYVGSMAWLEGPLAFHLHQGNLGPPKDLSLPTNVEVRKLETKNSVIAMT